MNFEFSIFNFQFSIFNLFNYFNNTETLGVAHDISTLEAVVVGAGRHIGGFPQINARFNVFGIEYTATPVVVYCQFVFGVAVVFKTYDIETVVVVVAIGCYYIGELQVRVAFVELVAYDEGQVVVAVAVAYGFEVNKLVAQFVRVFFARYGEITCVGQILLVHTVAEVETIGRIDGEVEEYCAVAVIAVAQIGSVVARDSKGVAVEDVGLVVARGFDESYGVGIVACEM